MMGSMVGALAETLALAQAAGVDGAQVMEMLDASAMANPICKAKGKMMLQREGGGGGGGGGAWPPGENFQLYLQQKDLRLALCLADACGVPAPITAAVNAQYVAARARGLEQADFAAVRATYEPAR